MKKVSHINIVTLTPGYADIKAEWATFKYVDSVHSLRRFSWLFAAQQVHSPRRFSWLLLHNLRLALTQKIAFLSYLICWFLVRWRLHLWGNNKQEELVVTQETGESMMRIQLLEQGTPYHLILNKYWTLQNLTLLCFDLEQIRDRFYTRDPPGRLGRGLGFAPSWSIAEQGASTSFMLQVRAIPRPLLLFGPPHGGWQKWSRNWDSSRHSGDIAETSF